MSRGFIAILVAFLFIGCAAPGAAVELPPPHRAQLSPDSRYGICETCGNPTILGQKACFHCLKKQASNGFTDLARRALERSREALESMKDPDLPDHVVEKLLEVKRKLQEHQGGYSDPDAERENRRQAMESLGKTPIGSDGRSINDLAREAVGHYLPALEGTDFSNDPIRTLTYYLVLDGKGFIRNVRFLHGPLGQPMTLLEAAEYYRGIDPAKSGEILQLLEDLRRLSAPDCPNDRVPALLDAIARSLKVLLK